MRNTSRFLLACGFTLVVSVLAACESRRAGEVASAELLGLEADQVMIDLEHYMTDEGIRRALLIADTAFTFRQEALLRLRNLEVTFFGNSGEEAGVLTADSGVYDLESGDITVDGNVVVVDVEGTRLETERLQYDATTDELIGDTAFVVYRDGSVERGDSFVADPNLEHVRTEGFSLIQPGIEGPP